MPASPRPSQEQRHEQRHDGAERAGRERPRSSRARSQPVRQRRPPRRLVLADGRSRLKAALLVVAFVLSLFLGRLVQLQGLDASVYATQATVERLQEADLPATRGSILDTNGVALAATVAAVNVTADPKLIADSTTQTPETVAAQLAPLLRLDEDELAQRLTGERRFAYVAKNVTPETWRAIKNLEPRPVGIFREDVRTRSYPGGTLAANLLGWLGGVGNAQGGLELALDAHLRGTDGKMTYERARDGRQIPMGERSLLEPVHGKDVQLTIDRDIQWYAERALTAKVRETKAESGTVVVYDPRGGDVLALATAPGFHPLRAGRATAEERQHRPLEEAYEPGSTGKILTAAAVIEEGAATPSTTFEIPNRLPRAGTTFKDWESHEAGLRLTLAGVLARSSNVGIIQAAELMGLDKLDPYFQKFGIGTPLGLGLPENGGILTPPESWSKTTPYTMAFGQGYSVNALQMAAAMGAIANDGVRLEPRLVKAVVHTDGTRHEQPHGEATRVVSPETARTVLGMLEGVTQEGGTAPKTKVPGYRVAGKTGTADRYTEECGGYCGYTMSYVGIAPADDPQLLVYVVLQDPQGSGGGSTAGPVFRDVMSFALKTLRIPPTGAEAPVVTIQAD